MKNEIKSIILNIYGETLNTFESCIEQKQITKNTKLTFPIIGFHKHCFGNLEMRMVSEKFDCIFCTCCNMRVIIPSNINTYGELKNWSDINIVPNLL